MPNVESNVSGLISAARSSVRNWMENNEKQLLSPKKSVSPSLENRLKTSASSRPGGFVDVYAPLDIMLNSSGYAFVQVYAAAMDSAFRVYRNNPGAVSAIAADDTAHYSPQEEILTRIRKTLPHLIFTHFPKLIHLTQSMNFFLDNAQRQVGLYLRHDSPIRPEIKESLERLQAEAQQFYALILQQKRLPFDNPTNPRRIMAIPPTYKG